MPPKTNPPLSAFPSYIGIKYFLNTEKNTKHHNVIQLLEK
jgi:hypothetical protein